ncbi:metal ABC transporter substrate-binding protein [Nocardiopsis algeriensis]|uniref:Manganese transport system substrate-binding protein n=1 Tax=Nocardiopsis algeriensis TaxID=1478215 RepID=A0A841IMQ6_9ACTN|nr:metal ABC transporter substrate-binding protein [Nocardiopsis algeriensis]MBB6119933.1 manganese transport system substrate-binding protein [Nocardiopsis algeriensis]
MANSEAGSPSHLWSAVSAAAVALALTACSAPAAPADDGRPLVLTTFTVLADMVDNVAADRVEVASLTRPGAEIHGYEPTPDDLVRGLEADLVLENGLGLEAWFAQFTERVDAPTATLTRGVETIPVSSGGHEGEPNPHAWMSPDNALVYVDNIRDALTDLDPAGKEQYAAAARDYKEQIGEVGDYLDSELAQVPEHARALVTCEGAFSYLARDAGLTEMYLWPVNAESEPTPGRIAAVTEYVRDNQVPAVFCESTVDDGTQRSVARESGARMGQTLYVDSLSEADGPVPTYLDLLRHDARAIVTGLKGERR